MLLQIIVLFIILAILSHFANKTNQENFQDKKSADTEACTCQCKECKERP